MTAHDRLVAAAGGADCLLIQHGETLIYRPLDGRPRSIIGIVVRPVPAPIAESRGPVTRHLQIKVLNDAIRGISTQELDTGGDKLDVAELPGKTRLTKTITSKPRST